MSPNKFRRALAPAYEELSFKEYLKGVEFVGRGRDRRMDYTFGVPTQSVDLELVALLTARGISAPAAEKQVRTHSPEAVHAAVAKFEARKKGGYTARNPGGLLSDMLAHPEKYPTAAVGSGGQPVLNAARKVAPVPTEEPPTPVREAKAAIITLGRHFEATPALRKLRDRAVALYLTEKVTTVDLASLSALEASQVERLLTGWEQK